MEHYTTAVLSWGGEVLLRPLSAHVATVLYRRVEDRLPPEPEIPRKMVKTAAGAQEEMPLSEDDEEYVQWREKFSEWHNEKKRIEHEVSLENSVLLAEYCVVAWRSGGIITRILRKLFPVPVLWRVLGLWWVKNPPASWEPHDLEISGHRDLNRRQLYIMSNILTGIGYSDLYLVEQAVIAPFAPVSTEEVALQRRGF